MTPVELSAIIACGEDSCQLNTEQIRFGLSNVRNPTLASYTFHILPYRGIGSGILRAREDWPQIEFIDNRRGNQFRVNLKRPEAVLEGVNALIEQIRQCPGRRTNALASLLNTSPKNIERWVKQLRKDGQIRFVGAPQTGGYYCI